MWCSHYMQVWSVAIILGVLNPLMNNHQPFSSHPGVIYGCFRKWWYPQIIHFNRDFPYKPSILRYPYFWKHPYIPLLYHECITILIHRKKSMPLTPGWSVASPILEAYRNDDRKSDRRWRFFSKLSLKSVFFFSCHLFFNGSVVAVSFFFWVLAVFFCWVYIVIVDFDARHSWNIWWEMLVKFRWISDFGWLPFLLKRVSPFGGLSAFEDQIWDYNISALKWGSMCLLSSFFEWSLQKLIRMKEVNQWTLSAKLQFSENKILWHLFSCIKTCAFQGPRVWAHWKLNSLKIQFASAILTRILCNILQNLGIHLCIKEDPWRSLKWCPRFFWGTPFFRRKLGHPGGFLGAILGSLGTIIFWKHKDSNISNTSQTSWN